MRYRDRKPENKVIRLNDFKRPKIRGMYAYKEIPYIDIKKDLIVTPLTLDISDIPDNDRIYNPEYEYEGKVYSEGWAWEICADGNAFYVIVYCMDDLSMGFFGGMGVWTPYQTVLFDKNREAVSEHSETGGAAHVRIADCKTPESLIRHLTVWGMVDSDYREEILHCNKNLKIAYKEMIALRDKIIDLYMKREAVTETGKVLLYDMADNTYKEFLVRNEDLLQSEEEMKLLVNKREAERKNRAAFNEVLSDVIDKLE